MKLKLKEAFSSRKISIKFEKDPKSDFGVILLLGNTFVKLPH